jgi:hypothetical protein
MPLLAWEEFAVTWHSVSCVCRECLANDLDYLAWERFGGAILQVSFTGQSKDPWYLDTLTPR